MPRTMTAADRKSLIRLASTLPAGSPERREILKYAVSPAHYADKDRDYQKYAYELGTAFAGYPHVAKAVANEMQLTFPKLSKKIIEGYEDGQGSLDADYDLLGYD